MVWPTHSYLVHSVDQRGAHLFIEQEPSTINEIVSLRKAMGLEVNGDDIQKLVEQHGEKLITNQLMDLRCKQ